ncbi:MAG: phytanoyl-CoA dioxygenase family protein [Hyphomicrobiaceae bacterium TMED74]|nr:restriction endonuclease subunit S [Filomicrobium sp.]RPG42047.1 MAG: phytanoyl-CoA dioxygenase family protein [Hyphomicrobiaceae bacterium TMED74]
MPGLTKEQIETFQRDGAIVVKEAVTPTVLSALKEEFSAWVNESRAQTSAYGEICDGRPRFDLDDDHTADHPSLRRVASPTDISQVYSEAAFDSAMTDMAADLVGPNVRFHHAKVNSKLPGTKTVVKWHQDFTFDPHSNDDTLTALLFLDDVTLDHGPLMIAPGSHRDPLHSLWQDGVFAGAVDDDVAASFDTEARPCYGPAGSVCLMHSRVAHASTANNYDQPRTLYIVTYAAADAVPLSPIAVPSPDAGRIVRGCELGRIRSSGFTMEIPEVPKGASFFVQQAQS